MQITIAWLIKNILSLILNCLLYSFYLNSAHNRPIQLSLLLSVAVSAGILLSKCLFVRCAILIECGSIRTARVRVRVRVRVSFGNENSSLWNTVLTHASISMCSRICLVIFNEFYTGEHNFILPKNLFSVYIPNDITRSQWRHWKTKYY